MLISKRFQNPSRHYNLRSLFAFKYHLLNAGVTLIFIFLVYYDYSNRITPKRIQELIIGQTVTLDNEIKNELSAENIPNSTFTNPFNISPGTKTLNSGASDSVHIRNDIFNFPIFPRYLRNPPHFIEQRDKIRLNNLRSKIASSEDIVEKKELKFNLSSILSDVVQKQLASLQQPENCSGINLICGHNNECGLGCQIHHRVACLIVSYALGVPLIHDENKWPYNDTWSSAFLPLGSKCQVGPETYRLEWISHSYPVLYKENRMVYNVIHYGSKKEKYVDQMVYPLENGIPIFSKLADFAEIVHSSPFIWWVGQFVKFALRLNPKMEQRIKEAKKEIDYKHPVVGLHVRRTDKIDKGKKLLFDIKDYMKKATQYYNKSANKRRQLKRVFVASDDATVFKTTTKTYRRWNVIGFKSRKTYTFQGFREHSLFEIVTDLFLLLESDFVVCGFYSNICSLLYEMRSFGRANGKDDLVSLHGKYDYILKGHRIKQKIVKVYNSHLGDGYKKETNGSVDPLSF